MVPDNGFNLLGMPFNNAGALLMASDVCKYCEHTRRIDVCPTGALFRTEFGSVALQQYICYGKKYCVSGVIDGANVTARLEAHPVPGPAPLRCRSRLFTRATRSTTRRLQLR